MSPAGTHWVRHPGDGRGWGGRRAEAPAITRGPQGVSLAPGTFFWTVWSSAVEDRPAPPRNCSLTVTISKGKTNSGSRTANLRPWEKGPAQEGTALAAPKLQ